MIEIPFDKLDVKAFCSGHQCALDFYPDDDTLGPFDKSAWDCPRQHNDLVVIRDIYDKTFAKGRALVLQAATDSTLRLAQGIIRKDLPVHIQDALVALDDARRTAIEQCEASWVVRITEKEKQ